MQKSASFFTQSMRRRGFSTSSSKKIVASVLFERLPVVIPKIIPVHNKNHTEQSTFSAEEAKNGYAAGNTARVSPTPAMVGPNMAMVAMPPNGVAGPTTNLNIGMDYWGGPAQVVPAIRSKLPIAASTLSVVSDNHMGSRDHSELWLQDEREMKRQRRKQSNRESARRSRLRKQAECEELAQRVDTLKQENGSLREELERMRKECQKLAAENASLSET